MNNKEKLKKILLCPVCQSDLEINEKDNLACKGCGEEYEIKNEIPIMLPSSSDAINKKFVEFYEETGEKKTFSEESIFLWERIKFFFYANLETKNKVIIDMGGGDGYIASKFVNAKKVFLVDLSYSQLNRVSKNKNMTLICGDVQKIFLKIRVDIILCTHLLEHLPNPKEVLTNFNKLLKDDGRIYISTPVLNLPFRKLVIYINRKFMVKDPQTYQGHLRVYSTKMLIADINDGGFIVDKIDYSPIKPIFHPFKRLNKLFARDISIIAKKKEQKLKKKLISIHDLFGSFSKFERRGLLSRILEPYSIYSKEFEKIYIKTLDNKKYKSLSSNVEHIPFINATNGLLRKFFYFFFSGFLHPKYVDCVELLGTNAPFTSLIYKLMGARIFLYHKWDFPKFVRELKGPFHVFLANIIQIFAFKIADTIAVTTKTLGEDVRTHTSSEKIYLLPNYVDTERFKPIETEKIKNSLIFVGRLHQQKNLPMLLQVMKQLPQFKLQIIGEGALKDELIDIKNRNEIKNVEFLGMIPHEKLPEYLNKAEAFIFTTLIEGHPKALIEAMSCGLPCIGSNVEGIRDVIVDGETGVLCEKNIEDIKKCILKLFEDRDKMREIGINARKFVVENYSMDKIIERRIKLIKGDLDGIEPLFSDTDSILPDR